MGQQPYIVFDEVQPESYWDEFAGDLAVYLLPMATIGATLYLWLVKNGGTQAALWRLLPMALLTLGGAMLLKYHFKYPSGSFPKLRIANLLKYVKVSGVRPVPCELSGTIIGRGIPGYIFSEDFVLKDPTGIVFLDYRQPLGIWEALFGLLRAGGYQGRSVVVRGWYFRSPVPYVQIDTMLCDGETLRSWVPALYRATAWACIIAAIVLFVLPKP